MTWVALPATTLPKFIVDLLNTRLAATAWAAAEKAMSNMARTSGLHRDRSCFTKASYVPHSTWTRQGD
jgi:hypothetical protein